MANTVNTKSNTVIAIYEKSINKKFCCTQALWNCSNHVEESIVKFTAEKNVNILILFNCPSTVIFILCIWLMQKNWREVPKLKSIYNTVIAQ